MKAVVWADTLQMLIMFGGQLEILLTGNSVSPVYFRAV